jgi:hypothetical protein
VMLSRFSYNLDSGTWNLAHLTLLVSVSTGVLQGVLHLLVHSVEENFILGELHQRPSAYRRSVCWFQQEAPLKVIGCFLFFGLNYDSV